MFGTGLRIILDAQDKQKHDRCYNMQKTVKREIFSDVVRFITCNDIT